MRELLYEHDIFAPVKCRHILAAGGGLIRIERDVGPPVENGVLELGFHGCRGKATVGAEVRRRWVQR